MIGRRDAESLLELSCNYTLSHRYIPRSNLSQAHVPELLVTLNNCHRTLNVKRAMVHRSRSTSPYSLHAAVIDSDNRLFRCSMRTRTFAKPTWDYASSLSRNYHTGRPSHLCSDARATARRQWRFSYALIHRYVRRIFFSAHAS